MRSLEPIYEAARRRIEKAENDPNTDWEKFWELELMIQRKALERALPNHRIER